MLDLQEKCSDFHFIIFGDMNSRTGDKNGMLESPADGVYSDEAEESFSRTSKDPTVNAPCQQLLDLCSAFECSVVNGLCDKRFDDGLTFISQTGGSVVDYFIVSSELCVGTFLSSFEIVPRVESSDLPIMCTCSSCKHGPLRLRR